MNAKRTLPIEGSSSFRSKRMIYFATKCGRGAFETDATRFAAIRTKDTCEPRQPETTSSADQQVAPVMHHFPVGFGTFLKRADQEAPSKHRFGLLQLAFSAGA